VLLIGHEILARLDDRGLVTLLRENAGRAGGEQRRGACDQHPFAQNVVHRLPFWNRCDSR
jgi:hypothetical protein